MTERLIPDQIAVIARDVARVRDLDKCIESLGCDVEDKADEWGKKARDIFGRVRMGFFTDALLGEVVFCAVVNALLRERTELTQAHASLVDFPPAPCPKQIPTGDAS